MSRGRDCAHDRGWEREREGKHHAEAPGFADPPAKISLLYESKDGRLCLFEDALGHLSAVRASRLA